jgi:energy-converting hydrogenase A subunit R
MGLIPQGKKLFEVLSRYDDLLALKGKEGYEPGNTLALIVPFLIAHKISSEALARVSQRAEITPGAKLTIDALQRENWKVYIISTSYEQHAYNIAAQLGIPAEHVRCTRFPIDRYSAELQPPVLTELQSLTEAAERKILELHPPTEEKDTLIKRALDEFFGVRLPSCLPQGLLWKVKVMGGSRKVEAIREIVAAERVTLSDLVTVGDSITDFKMLAAVNKAGGLAIVFNGNEYAIPYATVGLASTDLRDLLILTTAWARGRHETVFQTVKKLAEPSTTAGAYQTFGSPCVFHLIKTPNTEKISGLDEIIAVHKSLRRLMRGKGAAALG